MVTCSRNITFRVVGASLSLLIRVAPSTEILWGKIGGDLKTGASKKYVGVRGGCCWGSVIRNNIAIMTCPFWRFSCPQVSFRTSPEKCQSRLQPMYEVVGGELDFCPSLRCSILIDISVGRVRSRRKIHWMRIRSPVELIIVSRLGRTHDRTFPRTALPRLWLRLRIRSECRSCIQNRNFLLCVVIVVVVVVPSSFLPSVFSFLSLPALGSPICVVSHVKDAGEGPEVVDPGDDDR